VCAAPLAGQASPYIPLDDPRLPSLEHLIALGDVDDPEPMIRPFRRADAVRVLSDAMTRSATRDTTLVRTLLAAWKEDTAEAHWEVRARVGGQAYTEARRDPLHPAGDGGMRPYADLALTGTFGNFIAASRPALESRLLDDPDWPGRKDIKVTGRHVEGYLSAQFRWLRLFYGQMERNWGPVGVPGFGVGDAGYPRPELGFELGTDRFRLRAQAAALADQSDSAGSVIHRYFFAHRLGMRLSPRLTLGLWETTVLSGKDRNFDGRYRNPVTLLLLANEYGLGDDGNVLIGLDIAWRLRRATLQAQLAIDDIQYQNRSSPTRVPDRYGFTLQGTGPLCGRVAWRVLYTRATSLAFRAQDPTQSFVDQGVGLGRNFADDDQLTFQASTPIARDWLVTPELTLLRQGQGRLTDTLPTGTGFGSTPTIFIGTVERTWRAALGVSGQRGALGVRADAGFHYVQNDGHLAGRHRTRFVGRIEATLALSRRGRF
jgi:hypothetical protein